MLSTFPTFESMLGNPFPAFDAATTPWESHELFPTGLQLPEPTGSDVFQSPKPVISSSSSDNQGPNQDETEAMNPGPFEPDRKADIIDERKRRRMDSNRESARRSRMRKQKHLENLRNLVTKLRVENRDLSNRLRFTVYQLNRVRTENDHLQTEHTILRQKLLYSRRALIVRQLQRQFAYEQQNHPAPTISQYAQLNNNHLINC